MFVLCAAAFDVLLAWLIWRMAAQAHAYRALATIERGVARDWPSVAIVVPARDEADVIERCLRGLLDQDYPTDRLSIRLVDDGSSDATAAIALAAAGADPRFQLIRGGALKQNWTGKAYACSQGASAAGDADYLCFIDADTVARPSLIRSAVVHALDRAIAMISLEPFQELGSVLERLVFPCGLYLIAASQDVRAINDPESDAASANGQFLLVERDAYERIGGHGAVRGEICEDTALARRIKAAGLRFELLGAERLIATRMYREAGALWRGLAKNATALGGGSRRTVLIAGAGFSIVVTGVALATLAGLRLLTNETSANLAGCVLALLGASAMIGLHVAGARHFRIPLIYGLLFPIGYALAFILALDSARLQWLGRVEWKGRTYATPPPGPFARSPRRRVRRS